jgi:hypothetical protein
MSDKFKEVYVVSRYGHGKHTKSDRPMWEIFKKLLPFLSDLYGEDFIGFFTIP